jgi:hypothetical protein
MIGLKEPTEELKKLADNAVEAAQHFDDHKKLCQEIRMQEPPSGMRKAMPANIDELYDEKEACTECALVGCNGECSGDGAMGD